MLNDLGVDPNEWFDDPPNPLDTMPIARDEPLDLAPSSVEPVDDMPIHYVEVPTSVTNPKPEKKVEVVESIHHKMYAVATAKYNPFAVGGSESIHDFQGGSENVH